MKIARKRKVINTHPSVRHQMAAEFRVTYETVSKACKFLTEGDQPEAIRKRALELGGQLEYETVWRNA